MVLRFFLSPNPDYPYTRIEESVIVGMISLLAKFYFWYHRIQSYKKIPKKFNLFFFAGLGEMMQFLPCPLVNCWSLHSNICLYVFFLLIVLHHCVSDKTVISYELTDRLASIVLSPFNQHDYHHDIYDVTWDIFQTSSS